MYKEAEIDPTHIPELIESYKGALTIRQGESVAFTYNEKKKQLNCDATLAVVRDLLMRMNEELKTTTSSPE